MRKLLVLLLMFSPLAFSMPTGTLSCTSADSSVYANFEISNFGLSVILGLNELQVDGQKVDVAQAIVQRQWVDADEAKISITVPPDNGDFDKNVVIETTSSDGSSFAGEVSIWVRELDYASPLVNKGSNQITCELTP